MTLSEFRVAFPELSTATDPLVTRYLYAAELSIDATLFGARYNDAHGFLTAHLLCLSPFGKMARLSDAKNSTTYGDMYDTIRYSVVPSVMVP